MTTAERDELILDALAKLDAARTAAAEGQTSLRDEMYSQALARFGAAGVGTAERFANGWTA